MGGVAYTVVAANCCCDCVMMMHRALLRYVRLSTATTLLSRIRAHHAIVARNDLVYVQMGREIVLTLIGRSD